jgi:hypothetical protein
MNRSQKDDVIRWIKTWQKAGTALTRIKKAELQNPEYYKKNLALLNEMLWYAFLHRTDRKTSGLIEQQRFFRKLKTTKV